MKYCYLLLLICFSPGIKAQAIYEFDYAMECEKTDANAVSTFYIFTNSKDNSYQLVVTELDNANYRLHFSHNNGINAYRTAPKKSFLEAETVYMECSQGKYRSDYKFNVDRHLEYQIKQDTLIDAKSYHHYILFHPNKEIEKLKGTAHYIIYKETGFHLPILIPQGGEYAEWKAQKGIPDGIYRERYTVDSQGKKRESSTILQYLKHTKKIILSECPKGGN